MEKGTIKVSWFDEKNRRLLKSKMFSPDLRGEAIQYSKSKKDSATMELVSQDGNSYEWRLIPDENTWKMDLGVALFDNKLLMALVAVLAVMGLAYAFKLAAR